MSQAEGCVCVSCCEATQFALSCGHCTVCPMAGGGTAVLEDVPPQSHRALFLCCGFPLGYRRAEGTQWKACDTFRRNGLFRLPK